MHITPPSTPVNEYVSLCDAELKAKAVDLAAQLRKVVTADLAVGRQQSLEEWAAERRLSTQEERNVLGLRYEFQSIDRPNDLKSLYDSKFVPKADSLKHELIKRIPNPVETSSDAGQKGWTTGEMDDVANDLEKLAMQLSDQKCATGHVLSTAK